jgi:hypothetical protein
LWSSRTSYSIKTSGPMTPIRVGRASGKGVSSRPWSSDASIEAALKPVKVLPQRSLPPGPQTGAAAVRRAARARDGAGLTFSDAPSGPRSLTTATPGAHARNTGQSSSPTKRTNALVKAILNVVEVVRLYSNLALSTASSATRPRATFARMSSAVAVQMKGSGFVVGALHTRTAPRAEPPPCAPWSPVPQGHSSFVAASSQERAQSRIGSRRAQSRT